MDLVKTLIQATERAATATVPMQRQQAIQRAQRLRQSVEQQTGELYGITDTDLAAVGAALEGDTV